MNKTLFLAITIQEGEKFYSYAMKTASCNNLVSVLSGIKSLISVNVCDTWTIAKEIVAAWNETYKANGNYLFGVPSF